MAAVLVYGDPQSPQGSLFHLTGLVALPLLSKLILNHCRLYREWGPLAPSQL